MLRLVLHPRPQLIQPRRRARVVLRLRLLQQRFVRPQQRLGAVNLRLVSQRLQVLVAHIQHHQPARRLRVVKRRLLALLRGAIPRVRGQVQRGPVQRGIRRRQFTSTMVLIVAGLIPGKFVARLVNVLALKPKVRQIDLVRAASMPLPSGTAARH